jgi:hypothetical protein
MRHDKHDTTDIEPHVFDQTNGVVDLGSDVSPDVGAGKPDARSVAGIAMLSTQRP